MQRVDVPGRLGLRPLPSRYRNALLTNRSSFRILTWTPYPTSVTAVSEDEKGPSSEVKISDVERLKQLEYLKVDPAEEQEDPVEEQEDMRNIQEDQIDVRVDRAEGMESKEQTDSTVMEFRFEVAIIWVAAAVAFGFGIESFMGAEKAEEYFAGYILEQSLSVDNLFVFILIFKYFQTPLEYQPKVLNYGILTAGVLRLIMVLLGTEIIDVFHPVLLIFAGLLIYSSFQLLSVEERHDEDLEDNIIVRLCSRVFSITDRYDGDRFFTVSNGVKMATPLLLTLAVVELSDVVFAIDSVPAVFGITLDPFIVYSSNLFAILSLRSFYGLVSIVLDRLRFLDKSVAIVLGLIGVKMVADVAGYEVGTEVSLTVVAVVLGSGVLASIAFPKD